MMTNAMIATVILDLFQCVGDEVTESWVELQFCRNEDSVPRNVVDVDAVIEELVACGYLRERKHQYDVDKFCGLLVLTVEGWDHIEADRLAVRAAWKELSAWKRPIRIAAQAAA